MIGVNLRTYQAWEEGAHTPHALSMSEIERRMVASSKALTGKTRSRHS